MKLRCTKNSIRLRLRKSDMQLLASDGCVAESVQLPNGQAFIFQLCLKDIADIAAAFEQTTLTVSLPKTVGELWINTDQVGIEHFAPLKGEQKLHLLIEKDFPCAHRPGENKADTFQELQ